jgi:hypothetical protein
VSRARNVDFRPGAVYVLHQVEYLGFHDGIAKGTVHYEGDDAYKTRGKPTVGKAKVTPNQRGAYRSTFASSHALLGNNLVIV